MADAFAAFDWENDQRWKDYLRSVELIDDSPAALERLKLRFFKKTVDPSYVQTGAAPRASAASSGQAQRPAAREEPSTPSQPPSRSWASSFIKIFGMTATGKQMTLFLFHIALLALLLFHLVPVLPIVACSLRCYWMFMQLAVLVQGCKVYLKFGAPPGVWPFNWPSLSVWLSQAMASTVFFHMMSSFAFMSTRHSLTPAMAPMALVAARSALAYGNTHFRGNSLWEASGGRAARWAAANAMLLDQAACWAEIAIGFVLILMLLTPSRSFMLIVLIFFYWQMLKVRYVMPESAAGHRQVWQWLDQKSYSFRAQVPIVERGIQAVKAWFLNLDGMRR